MIRIQREAKSRIWVPVESSEDPTVALVFFSFPLRGERPTVFTAGAWLEVPVFDTRRELWTRPAVTPRIGEGALDLPQSRYRFFGKLSMNGDEDIWEIDDEGLEIQ